MWPEKKGDLRLYWPEGFDIGRAQDAVDHFYLRRQDRDRGKRQGTLSTGLQYQGGWLHDSGPRQGLFAIRQKYSLENAGAKEPIPLAWIQNWTGTYKEAENIGLVPEGGGGPRELGVYRLVMALPVGAPFSARDYYKELYAVGGLEQFAAGYACFSDDPTLAVCGVRRGKPAWSCE